MRVVIDARHNPHNPHVLFHQLGESRGALDTLAPISTAAVLLLDRCRRQCVGNHLIDFLAAQCPPNTQSPLHSITSSARASSEFGTVIPKALAVFKLIIIFILVDCSTGMSAGCAPFRQALERTNFVSAHEATIALDICCEDCDEASADFRRV
jgi:hypothetical protein